MRTFKLDRYVVKRDPMGNVTHIAVKETVAPMMLPESVREEVHRQEKESTCDLYTAIVREDDEFKVYQDVKGMLIEESVGRYPLEKSPWLPLRYTQIDGEDYGRGFVEEYIGDIRSLESLTKSIVEASAAAAKVLFMVNPNGTTRARTLAEAPNGAIVQGSEGDVSVLQLNKFNDLRTAQTTMAGITDRLSQAFLLTSGVVRDAERVTAEEIRMLSQELEAALGGLYSLLAQEMQLPIVTRLMDRMSKEKRLPKLPKDIVKPTIVTGVEALGRGNDLNRLDMFLAGANQIVGPQAVNQYLNVSDYFKRRATALGIETEGLIKTEEEIQQAMQMQQQQEMMMKLGSPAVAPAINAAQEQYMAQEQEQPTEE
jgi:ribosomal 50S subunit-recycling heat shock protein